MARRTRLRIDWAELPTRYRDWKSLPRRRKLLWALGRTVRILFLYGIFAIVVIWYNLPETFAAIVGGDQAAWTLLPPLVSDWELLLLLLITIPMFAFIVIVPHRRVDRHGREVH